MADTWGSAEAIIVEVVPAEPAAPPDQLKRIVRDSLRRELEARRDRAPHAQLGVVVGADQATVHRAFTRLRAHFDPQAYAVHGPEAMALAGDILTLVQTAYLQLGSSSSNSGASLAPMVPMTRNDETLRALETLRGSIARRKAEALRLSAAGQLVEARRMFEAVLRLDPHDEVARAQLRRLRQPAASRRAPWELIRSAFAWMAAFVRKVVRRA